jgi:hypothetical protein
MPGPLSHAQYNKLIDEVMDAWEGVLHARAMASLPLGPTTMTTVDDLVAAAYARTKTASDLIADGRRGPYAAGSRERIAALIHEIEVAAKTIEAMTGS